MQRCEGNDGAKTKPLQEPNNGVKYARFPVALQKKTAITSLLMPFVLKPTS
jgi:hypothetical protein